MRLTPPNRRREPPSAVEQRAVFMKNAKHIGENLSRTFWKLEQLTTSKHPLLLLLLEMIDCILVAKQSSLFNDRAKDIQGLTIEIKEDMSSLNSQIAELQQVDQLFFPRSSTSNSHLFL